MALSLRRPEHPSSPVLCQNLKRNRLLESVAALAKSQSDLERRRFQSQEAAYKNGESSLATLEEFQQSWLKAEMETLEAELKLMEKLIDLGSFLPGFGLEVFLSPPVHLED